MPIRKDEQSITSLHTTLEQEQRISNSIMKAKVELKDSTLSRMTATKSIITFYHQKVTGGNNYMVNAANIQSTDPNTTQFEKIEEFVIVCQSEISASSDNEDAGKTITQDGSFKVFPNTLKPLPNDHFVMDVAGKKNLYKVTEVSKTTVEDDAAYECAYTLVEEDTVTKLSEIENNVIETYIFQFKHVGTSFRTIYRKDEYKYFEALSSLYNTLGEVYNMNFYDKFLNTYFLQYVDVDIPEVNKPYYTVPINVNYRATEPALISGYQKRWAGSYMYDRELINFIMRNDIFEYVNRKIYRPTQYIDESTDPSIYANTIFHSIEKKDYKMMRYTHVFPSVVSHASPSTLPHLYGKVDLMPCVEALPGCMLLLPIDLVTSINTKLVPKTPQDYMINDIDNLYALCYDIISYYINRTEKVDFTRLLYLLNTHIDDFVDENKSKIFQFYVYPLIGYITKKTMEIISDKNYYIYT